MSDQEKTPQSEQEDKSAVPEKDALAENDLEKVAGGFQDFHFTSLDPSVVKADPLPQGIGLPSDPKLKP